MRVATAFAQVTFCATVVIAAHGSWEQGKLPTNLARITLPRDFLGFKAHFNGASLARDLMPLIAFPGGYGCMVWVDHDRLSLSFCIQRATLATARQARSGAAEAAFAQILRSSPGVDETLRNADLAGGWLAAGPIRPAFAPDWPTTSFASAR